MKLVAINMVNFMIFQVQINWLMDFLKKSKLDLILVIM